MTERWCKSGQFVATDPGDILLLEFIPDMPRQERTRVLHLAAAAPDLYEDAERARELLKATCGALIELREAVKTVPAMNNAKYNSLGIGVNRAIDTALTFLSTQPALAKARGESPDAK